MSRFLFTKLARHICVTCLLITSATATGAETQKKDAKQNSELAFLDTRFQQLSTRFYTGLVRLDKSAKIDSIEALAQTVERYREQGQIVNAIATIFHNRALVEKNIDTTPIINIYKV